MVSSEAAGGSDAETSGNGSTAGTSGNDGGNPGTSEEGSEVKPEEEESDLQLSWEVLELARLICQRSEIKWRNAWLPGDMCVCVSGS